MPVSSPAFDPNTYSVSSTRRSPSPISLNDRLAIFSSENLPEAAGSCGDRLLSKDGLKRRERHKFELYEQAFKKNEVAKRRRALTFARATRHSLYLQQQAANQKVKEYELYLSILRLEAEDARLKVQAADVQVGQVRNVLASDGIAFDADTEDFKLPDPFDSDLDCDDIDDDGDVPSQSGESSSSQALNKGAVSTSVVTKSS